MKIQNNNKKRGIIIKQINRKGIKKLFENNYKKKIPDGEVQVIIFFIL